LAVAVVVGQALEVVMVLAQPFQLLQQLAVAVVVVATTPMVRMVVQVEETDKA
jgi:hypothetical protein